jgi:hypothetical protein
LLDFFGLLVYVFVLFTLFFVFWFWTLRKEALIFLKLFSPESVDVLSNRTEFRYVIRDRVKLVDETVFFIRSRLFLIFFFGVSIKFLEDFFCLCRALVWLEWGTFFVYFNLNLFVFNLFFRIFLIALDVTDIIWLLDVIQIFLSGLYYVKLRQKSVVIGHNLLKFALIYSDTKAVTWRILGIGNLL